VWSAQVAHRQVLERPEAQQVWPRDPAKHWSGASQSVKRPIAASVPLIGMGISWKLHDWTAGPEGFRNHSAGGREGGRGGGFFMRSRRSAVRSTASSTELQRACRPSSFRPDVQRAAG